MTTKGATKSYDLEEISNRLAERAPELIEELGISSKYLDMPDHLSMACPIHDGDNPQGFSILKRGVGNWKCFTHGCHEKWGTPKGASLISLIQAYRNIPFANAVEWAAKFTGVGPSTMEQLDSFDEKGKFIQVCKTLTPKTEKQKTILTPEYLRRQIEIPALYFQKRGFSKDILKSYDVGTCIDSSKPYFNRVIVPLYDDDGKSIIGCTGRSIYDKCGKCNYFHNPSTHCPITNTEILNGSKWRNTSSSIEDYLYNFWTLRGKSYDTIILVEGAPDVWKLVQYGIHNCVALLGTKFTAGQSQKLQSSGILNLVIATDNDEAGNDARQRIRNECKRMFNIVDIVPSKKDFGEMDEVEIKKVMRDFSI